MNLIFPLAARSLFTQRRNIKLPAAFAFANRPREEGEPLSQDVMDNAVDAISTEDVATETEATATTDETVATEPTGEATTEAAGSLVIPQPELGASLPAAQESAERREVEGGRAYEMIFITRAGDADATEASIARLRTLIENEGGAIDTVRTSEVRRLAYAIKREIEGVYTVVNARFGTQHLAEIDRFFKLEESVLRHMILREEV